MYGPGIHNLIFDLGGVILNLDVSKTMDAFGELAGIPGSEIKDTVARTPFFNDYEKGLITDSEFRDHLRRLLNVPVTDAQLDHAWNAMLGTLPVERLRLLESLAEKHQVFLLSNTNNIHLQFLNGIVHATSGHTSLTPFFKKDYYSHLLKMRKPDVEIFEHVLTENNLAAAETLLLDDNTDNLRGAAKAGIKTIRVTHPDQLFSIFS